MHIEEKKRMEAKWAVIHCPWDKVKKTNIPKNIVSRLFDDYKEAEIFMQEQFPKRKEYEYAVLKTDGKNIFM